MSDPDLVWSSFSRDPRVPEDAQLRASDADREVVHRVLADAYADGRIDRDELDSRTTRTQAARTLGELLPPLDGLVPSRPTDPSGPAPTARLHERAVESWRKDRRDALWGLVSVSAIVWTIWLVGSWGPDGFDPYFPWPLFVTLAALLNVGRLHVQREDIVGEELRRLEKKQRKELERRRREDEG